MKTMTSGLVHGAVEGGVIKLPRGLLQDGAQVLVLPLDWLRTSQPTARGKKAGVKRKFVSEDLVGCHVGDGSVATNAVTREKLRRKAG